MNGVSGQLMLGPISKDVQGGGKISSKSLLRLLETQGKRCALTGMELTPKTVSLDHIVPLDAGGADDISNVQLVHSIVNTMKGTMSQADFVHWCKQVASHCIFDGKA